MKIPSFLEYKEKLKKMSNKQLKKEIEKGRYHLITFLDSNRCGWCGKKITQKMKDNCQVVWVNSIHSLPGDLDDPMDSFTFCSHEHYWNYKYLEMYLLGREHGNLL